MKKNIKRIFGIALLLTVSISTLSYCILAKYPNKPNAIEKELAIVDLNEVVKSNEYKEFLISKYGYNYEEKLAKNVSSSLNARKIEKSFIEAKTEDKLYPDYYGGMYVNDNNDLVIQIVRNDIPNKKSKNYSTYNSILNVDDNAIIEYVNNSYNDLEIINNKIIEYFSSDNVEYNHLIGNYIDVYSNKVIVELKNNTLEEQEEFKEKVVNSNLITFTKGENTTTTKDYYPGQNYQPYRYNSNGNLEVSFGCSIGYRATRNTEVGFVTAGHCVIDYDQVDMGTVVYATYGRETDMAFVRTNSGQIISKILNSTGPGAYTIDYIIGYTYWIGTNIAKAGYKTGYQAGTITAFNYSAYYDDDKSYHTGLIKTSAYTLRGDSGGPVFMPSLKGTQEAHIIGITVAMSNNNALFYDYDSIKNLSGAKIY